MLNMRHYLYHIQSHYIAAGTNSAASGVTSERCRQGDDQTSVQGAAIDPVVGCKTTFTIYR